MQFIVLSLLLKLILLLLCRCLFLKILNSSPLKVAKLARSLAQQLAELHACGLVHFDVKPRNVLLKADTEVKAVKP